MQLSDPNEPGETITFTNPTEANVSFTLHDDSGKNNARRYVVPPGADIALPLAYALAVHHVICHECSATGAAAPCRTLKHEGQIVAGLAPQLVHKGQLYKHTVPRAASTAPTSGRRKLED